MNLFSEILTQSGISLLTPRGHTVLCLSLQTYSVQVPNTGIQ